MSFFILSNNYNDHDKQGYYDNIQYGDTIFGNSDSVRLPTFDCEAELLNSELWNDFHKLGTEMIITKSGRCMFPIMNVRFHGLEEGSQYEVCVELRSTSSGRWTRAGGHWTPTSPLHASSPLTPVINTPHPMSPSPASLWSQPFKFNNLKLTNNQYDMSGNVILKSMHKYLPVLKIRRLGSRPAERCFTFPETEFIAVTAYQNHDVAQLKIDKNPYAKGFRERERKRTKLKTQESTPSPVIEEIPSPQSQPLDCSFARDLISSNESLSPSPEVFVCDSPPPSHSPNITSSNHNYLHSPDYLHLLMSEWTRSLVYRPTWPPMQHHQWHLSPTWHAPVQQKICNDDTKPKGSSFTIRALLQKN